MRRRYDRPAMSGEEERKATDALKSLVAAKGDREPDPPEDAYWANMLVRSNRRIDDVSSGKAISISWAARVAIPGVVAIVSFMIALYYYTPEYTESEGSLTSVMMSVDTEILDSMSVQEPRLGQPNVFAVAYRDLADLPAEDIQEYLVTSGKTSLLLGTLTEQQVSDLIVRLGARKTKVSTF